MKYNFDDLSYAYVESYTGKYINKYVQFFIKNKEKSIVVREIIVGEVSLYNTTSFGVSPDFGPGGVGGIPRNFSYNKSSYTINNYYLKRKKDTIVTHLGFNQFFLRNFRQGASRYFQDYSELAERIENKE